MGLTDSLNQLINQSVAGDGSLLPGVETLNFSNFLVHNIVGSNPFPPVDSPPGVLREMLENPKTIHRVEVPRNKFMISCARPIGDPEGSSGTERSVDPCAREGLSRSFARAMSLARAMRSRYRRSVGRSVGSN